MSFLSNVMLPIKQYVTAPNTLASPSPVHEPAEKPILPPLSILSIDASRWPSQVTPPEPTSTPQPSSPTTLRRS